MAQNKYALSLAGVNAFDVVEWDGEAATLREAIKLAEEQTPGYTVVGGSGVA